MCKTSLCLLAALLISTPAYASEADAIVARLQQTVDDFNKGDAKALASDMVDAPQIIDEFPPFFWAGPNAFEEWNHAFEVDAQRRAITGTSMRLLKARAIDVRGDSAYAVVPAICDFTRRDGHATERGILTVALEKSAQSWRIAAFAWARTAVSAPATPDRRNGG